MRLAPDPISIKIGGEGFTLSPSLRAAMRIARKHGDYQTALKAVLDGNLTGITDLIREGGAGDVDLIAAIKVNGLGRILDALIGPLSEFILALAGYDPDAPASTTPTGPVIPFAEYHAQLFKIATGWLGWSPAQAWAATPAEIEAAFNGRADMLKAIFGGADAEQPTEPPTYTPERIAQIEEQGFDPAFDRAGLKALKHKGRAR